MLAISSDDFINYDCVNENCDSNNIKLIDEIENYMVVECQKCHTRFIIYYGNIKVIKMSFNTGRKDEFGKVIYEMARFCPHPKKEPVIKDHTF